MSSTDLQERPRRRNELSAWYSELLTDQQTSGLSLAEYAVALGLAPTTLYQWKRRLARPPRPRVERSVKQAAQAGLIQLSLPQPAAPVGQEGFVVRLAGGRELEVPDDFDDEVLQRLLKVLERC